MMQCILRCALSAIVLVTLAACGGGEGDSSSASSNTSAASTNRAPRATILATGDVRADAGVISVTLGGLVQLDGATSNDEDNDALTYAWTVVSRPAGSSISLPSTATAAVEWRPDAMGAYNLQLRVTDTKGASGLQNVVINVDNRAPLASLVVTPQFTPIPAVLPTQSVSVGANVLFDATNSTDPDGDAITMTFDLFERPLGSTTSISVTGRTARLVTDAPGLYRVRVRGTDSRGASFESTYGFNANNGVPVPNVVVAAQFTSTPSVFPAQAVTQGANVLLDATSSTDPDGDALTVTFELYERPVGSNASLSITGRTARLTPDALGLYRVRIRGTDTRGASRESIYVFNADNRAPNPVAVTSLTPVVANAGQASFQTSVGYDVVLNGGSSSDPDGDVITRDWVMTSRPVGSAATLSAATGVTSGFSPDVLGNYVVTLTVTDSRGARSVYTTTIQANNRRPIANIGSNATPQALPNAPSIRLPLGTEVTLRGSSSTDADGDVLTYAWSITARPAGSTAALSASNVADPRFIADREGSYVFRLRVTDGAGAYSERSLGLDVGTHAPVAVVNRQNMTVLVSNTARASAALSFDDDGDSLSYQWTLDARPVGSAATIANPGSTELAFTPDVPGLYVAAVTVRDAAAASVAYVNIRVLSQMAGSVTLGFMPDDARYSVGLDKVVAVAANPSTVRIIDPFTSAIRTVALPAAVKNFSLSPDGRLAVVLHEGIFSLVDLNTATIVRSTASGGAHTDAFVTNAGMVFLIGQTGGQWVNESVVTIDGRTGVKVTQTGGYMGMFYGTQYGVFADRLNKVFLMEQGLSPADIHYFSFNPTNSQVTRMGDSPYHGDYTMIVPLYLSGNQDLLFTSVGNFFRTDTLAYGGTLAGVTRMLGFSHSSTMEEALVLQAGPSTSGTYPYTPTYPSAYKRFTGSLLLADADLPLPLLGGAQTYGIKVFHSAAGNHVLLVQTGSNEVRGTGAQYHVIVR